MRLLTLFSLGRVGRLAISSVLRFAVIRPILHQLLVVIAGPAHHFPNHLALLLHLLSLQAGTCLLGDLSGVIASHGREVEDLSR